MNYRHFLNAGSKVSTLGFGAWQLGVESGWKAVSAANADRMIRTALDSGIKFYDTAPNDGHGTNSSGFSGLPGGDRFTNGLFLNNGGFGYWWSSSSSGSSAWLRWLGHDFPDVLRSEFNLRFGFSVHCLKDSE